MTFTLDSNLLLEQIKKAVAEAIPVVNMSTPDMISKAELAKKLEISESGVDQLRRDRIIKGYRLGKGVKSPIRFILSEVIADIKEHNKTNSL